MTYSGRCPRKRWPSAGRLSISSCPADRRASIRSREKLASPPKPRARRPVVSVGMAEVDDRTIVGMDGLTTRRTRHGLVLGGVGLWTWCAYDIVGIAAALGVDAVGNTTCGGCGRPIEVVVREGQPEANTAVGWLPDESCSNVMVDFCPSALLLCSQPHLDEWKTRESVGTGEAMDLESLAERGRSFWGPLVP
jgi:alkylmercury lyase